MGNKVAYRLPSISLLSLDFPLPSLQSNPPSTPQNSSFFISSQTRLPVPSVLQSGGNVLPHNVNSPTYAYTDQSYYPTTSPVYEVQFPTPSGSSSPSVAPGSHFPIGAIHQANDMPVEYTTRAKIPSHGSVSSVPGISNHLSTINSPPTSQYVGQPQWPRHTSEYMISYNSSQTLSPSNSSMLLRGSNASDTLVTTPKNIIVANAPERLESTISQSPHSQSYHKPVDALIDPPKPVPKPVTRVHKSAESLKRKKRECSECHRFFSNLATHKSTHLNPTARPHVCKICGRGFSRPNDLFRHFKCHWKKIGADGGQFRCPFKSGPHGDQCCHLLGIFSRCDTFKNHLKAIHFQYPGGTRKSERSLVPGCCRLCKKEFRNVDEWFSKHVENGECSFIDSSK